MPTPPSASWECRGSSAIPTLQGGRRFNSEIISSMIESLITAVRGGRPTTIVSVTGSICRENTYDEFRG